MGERPRQNQPDETPERHACQTGLSQREGLASTPAGVLSAPAMNPHACYQRGVQAAHRGEFEKALQYFTQALELDHAFAPAWVGQVRMFLERGELRQASLWLTRALERFKTDGDLLAARAVLQTRRGETPEARASSEAALQAPGRGACRWVAHGEVMLSADPDQVETSFRRALAEPDADGFTHLSIARIYRRYRRYTDALVAARRATEAVPQAPFAWYVRGLCERDLAIRAYRTSLRRALELDPAYAAARKALSAPAGASWLVRLLRRIRRL